MSAGRSFDYLSIDNRNIAPYKYGIAFRLIRFAAQQTRASTALLKARPPATHRNTTGDSSMQNKPVALVTGANQGIGFQIAKDLMPHGFTVLLGSRNFERGEAAAKELGPGAIPLQ